MIQPKADTLKGLAHIARNSPAVMEWLEENQRVETQRLPYTPNNVAVAQGRCQVLGELLKLIHEAPENAA